MIALPICAHLIFQDDPHRMFVVETFGVWAFGVYWLIKTVELRHSDVEEEAMTGQLPGMNPRNWRWRFVAASIVPSITNLKEFIV